MSKTIQIETGARVISNITGDVGRVAAVDATTVTVTWLPGDDREATRPMPREDFVWMTRPSAEIEMIYATGSREPQDIEWAD